jgi:hypothetical protein
MYFQSFHIVSSHRSRQHTMPASQLAQLKAALSGAGLDRKSHSKKDKKAFKKGGARETDRAKTLQKLEDIRKGLNKFDERETKVGSVIDLAEQYSSSMMSEEETSKVLWESLVLQSKQVWTR